MAGLKLAPLEAAKILLHTRDAILAGRSDLNGDEKADLKIAGKQISGFQKVTGDRQNIAAALLKELDVLVVTGSQVRDYPLYNIRPNRTLSWRKEEEAQITALRGDWEIKDFHSGFLLHAARVLKWLGNDRPKFIVGHSLGAASAQILGNHLNVPTLCLASPQVIKRRKLVDDPMRLRSNPQWKILNIAWRQDTVTSILRPVDYRCLGHRVIFIKANTGIDHFVQNYMGMIEDAENEMIIDSAKNRRSLPKAWHSTELPIIKHI